MYEYITFHGKLWIYIRFYIVTSSRPIYYYSYDTYTILRAHGFAAVWPQVFSPFHIARIQFNRARSANCRVYSIVFGHV